MARRKTNPDLVKRIAELVNDDQWLLGDLLVEEFPPEEFGDADRAGGKSDLYAELEEYSFAVLEEYGIALATSTLRQKRATALAWPSDERSSLAPFEAHAKLRGPDRFERMDRYLKMNRGKPLTWRAVTRFIAEENPRPTQVKPWEQQVYDRIERAAKATLLEGTITKRPDWWTLSTDTRRDIVIKALRSLASAIAAGPKE